MKKIELLTVMASAAMFFSIAHAVEWKGLDEASWYSGPKLTAEDLAGKVVLVDNWGVYCGPCRASLPRIEQIWKSFKSKPFMLVGSHCQGREDEKVAELVKENKLTYPMYERFSLANDAPSFSGIPFIYVVNHRGKVVYAGHSDREATVAVVDALGKVDADFILCDDIVFRKYKVLGKKIVFGKSVRDAVKLLKADIAKAEAKGARPPVIEKAQEAQEILKSLANSQSEIKEEIAHLKTENPPKALKLAKMYMTTFPDDAAAYKADIAAMTAAAKAFEAEQKAKAKTAQ